VEGPILIQAVMAQFAQLFHGVLDSVAFFNGLDQVAVTHVVVSVLQFRMVAFTPPSAYDE